MNLPALVTDLSLESINRALVALANAISSSSGGATILLNTSTWFVQNNPTPLVGQICLETDTKFWKFGDGATSYKSLAYQWKVPYIIPAPLPQTAAGVGQWSGGANGQPWVLPAGGTWAYWGARFSTVTGIWDGGVAPIASIAAGGTTIGAGAANTSWLGFQWRIA